MHRRDEPRERLVGIAEEQGEDDQEGRNRHHADAETELRAARHPASRHGCGRNRDRTTGTTGHQYGTLLEEVEQLRLQHRNPAAASRRQHQQAGEGDGVHREERL